MKWRTILVVSALWCVVVAIVATVVWGVIDDAGRDVVAEAPPVSASTTGGPDQPNGQPGSTPTRKPHPEPSRSPTPTGTTAPSPQGEATPTDTSPSEGPSSGGSQTSHSGGWSGTAGVVTATCTGSVIRLGGATPADNWSIEVSGRGPAEEIEVKFERESGGEMEVKVRARCASGAPTFSTEVESE